MEAKILYDHVDFWLTSCPDKSVAEVKVLLDREGIGYGWLIVAEKDSMLGQLVYHYCRKLWWLRHLDIVD